MSIDTHHCFAACVKAGLENPSSFSPATLVVAVATGRRFVTDPIQQ